MDNQKAWDIVIAEVEGECRLHAECGECPLKWICVDETPYSVLKQMKEVFYSVN